MATKTQQLAMLCLIVGLAVSTGFAAGDEAQKKSKPHIILVMADDQGWGDTGYNGHPFVKTPSMDAMAAEGFVFDRFYAAAPVCSPTRASVMTGRHPIRSRVHSYGNYMRPQEQTIAKTLKAAGYVTGIFGKLHIGSGQPGTDCNPSGMGFDEWVIGLNFFDNDPYLSRGGKVEKRQGKGSVVVVDDAIQFLHKHKAGDKPLFMVVWFPSPHSPHAELPDGAELYEGQANAGYYREITLLDQQLGRLRSELKSLKIEENTILWYCSDNGGLVHASAGGRAMKGSIYEGGLRIPSIVQWPAGKLQGRSAVPASTSDIYPTVLSLAGMDLVAPHPLDGIDVSGIMQGRVKERAKPIGFWSGFGKGDLTRSDAILKAIMEKQQAGAPLPHDEPRLRMGVDDFTQHPHETAKGHAAWNQWPWKLHRINGDTYELYDLEKDPMEATNLADQPENKERLARMQKDLDVWMRSVVRSLNGDDYRKN